MKKIIYILSFLSIFVSLNSYAQSAPDQSSPKNYHDNLLSEGYEVVDSIRSAIEKNQVSWTNLDVFKFLVETTYQQLLEDRLFTSINLEGISTLNQKQKILLSGILELHLHDSLQEGLLEEIKSIHLNHSDIYLQATSAILLAEYYLKTNLNEEAYNFFKKARNRGKHSSFKTIGIISNIIQANFYFKNQLYERAFTFGQKAQVTSELINNEYWETRSRLLLSKIQISLMNFEEAFNMIKEVDDNLMNIQHPIFQARREMYLGQYFSNIGEFNQAKSYYNSALIKAHRSGLDPKIGELYLLLADELMRQDLLAMAKENYRLSLLYLKNDSSLLARSYLGLGKLHNKLKEYNAAIDYFEKVNSLISLKEKEKSKYYFEIAESYKGLKNYKQSVSFYKKHIAVSDSVQYYDLMVAINELNSLFETEKKERKILEQAQRIKEKEDRILLNKQELENEKLRTRFLFLSVIFLILFFGVILSLILTRTKQIKLQQNHKASELKQAILRLQMNPHFIFNSFTVIQSFIYEKDQKNSSKFLVDFSRLIRLILEKSSEEKISLTDETEMLHRYLEVQKMRFKDRFNYSISLANEVKRLKNDILIPPLLCQPFVENAIEHGQLDKVKNGNISVKFSIIDDLWLEVIVQDNGIGINNTSKSKGGRDKKSLALKISNERIQLINEQSKLKASLQVFDLKKINQRGTRVVIKIPLMVKS